MAFGRLERTARPQPMSDINMTPLIDVMLVLLVIFMLTAPLMANHLPLNLPQSDAAQAATSVPAHITISLNAQGQMDLDGQSTDAAHLPALLQAAAKAHADAEVHLRADKGVPYGQVAEVIGQAQQAGLTRIALVADKPARVSP